MKSVWLGMASVLSGTVAGVAVAQSAASPTSVLQTVVVTAEYVAEPLNKVPAAITALEGSDLNRLGAQSVTDFAALVPGLTFSGGGAGGTTLVLRGITTGGIQSSANVGVLVDGVPYGASTGFDFAGLMSLDSSLWDIQRVEVLRGPQGTLYGASAMSGIISYVYNMPSLTHYEAQAETGVSSTEHGGTSYDVRGILSVPLISDVLGFRLAASHEDRAGYIDNPTLGRSDINRDGSTFVRGALLFKPTDALTAELEGFYKETTRDASDYVIYDRATGRPLDGPLDNSLAVLDPATFRFTEEALTVNYAFPSATLTSITSYQRDDAEINQDFTGTAAGADLANPLLGVLLHDPSFVPATNADLYLPITTGKFTQELRLASATQGPLRYVGGLFFTNEQTRNGKAETLTGLLADGLPVPGPVGLFDVIPSNYLEKSAFAQVTYSVTHRLDLTAGARYTRYSEAFSDTNGGLLGVLVPNVPSTGATANEENYLFDARYALTQGSNLYVRAGSGYRPGGPNPAETGIPLTFGPDRLWDYEGGYKGTTLDGRVDLQLDAFYISWRNVQLTGTNAQGFNYIANGKDALSKGLEAQGAFRPFTGMTVSANIAYIDAYLEQAAPLVQAVAGERLPNSARWSGALVGDYTFPLRSDWNGFVGATLSATGDRTSSFNDSTGSPQFLLGSYVLGDVRAGIQSDRWTLTAYVLNIGDRRAELSASTSNLNATGTPAEPGTPPEAEVEIAQPRTFGLTLDVKL
jgi:iron complex outermembrane recepter protein